MKSALLQLMNDKKIASIYTDTSNTDKFSVGYILAVSDDFVLLNAITVNGINDGLYLIQLNDIFKVSFDGEYEVKIKKLYDLNNQVPQPYIQGKNLFFDFFTDAHNQNLIVSIKLCDAEGYDASGFVENITSEFLTLKCVTDYGKYDGVSKFRNECITKASCNSDYEITLKKIIELNCNNTGMQQQ